MKRFLKYSIVLLLFLSCSSAWGMKVYTGNYTGNGVDDRWIDVAGMNTSNPRYILIVNDAMLYGVNRFPTQSGDTAFQTSLGLGPSANLVQQWDTTRFQIGS